MGVGLDSPQVAAWNGLRGHRFRCPFCIVSIAIMHRPHSSLLKERVFRALHHTTQSSSSCAPEDLEEMYPVQDMCWEDFALSANLSVKRNPEDQQITGLFGDLDAALLPPPGRKPDAALRGKPDESVDVERNLQCLGCLDSCHMAAVLELSVVKSPNHLEYCRRLRRRSPAINVLPGTRIIGKNMVPLFHQNQHSIHSMLQSQGKVRCACGPSWSWSDRFLAWDGAKQSFRCHIVKRIISKHIVNTHLNNIYELVYIIINIYEKHM